jgi:AcrR family transcriptional regulator
MATGVAATPAGRRRLQRREHAQRAILDATEALLVEDGYEGFSMRRLADRCGYTAPTIYHYFGDKQGLIDALLEERMRRVLRRLRRVRRRDDPAETVRAQVEALVRFGLQNPTPYRLFTAPGAGSRSPGPSAEEVRAIFEDPLQELDRAGRLRAGFEDVKQCLWVVLHGVIVMQTDRPEEGWSKTLLDTAIGAMLGGLIAPPPGGGPERAPTRSGS